MGCNWYRKDYSSIMNICVQAEVLSLGATAELTTPKISVVVNIIDNYTHITEFFCLSQPTISINGHSISGINPEFAKVGELATSLA
jgi:hypothetical protein